MLHADADRHPDLFWAIRGGGGNFGVATRFQFRLHPLDGIVGGMLLLPATPEVIAGFVAAAEAAPEELSAIANVMAAPPLPFIPAAQHGQLVVLALLVYAGDAEAGERALAPFRALAEPIADMVAPMPYPEMFPPEEEELPPDRGRHHTCSSTPSTARWPARSSGTWRPRTRPCRAAQLRVLGGAMARVPAEATAFAHRHSRDHGQRRRASTTARPTEAVRQALGRRLRGRPAPGRHRRLRQLPRRRGPRARSARPTRARPGTGWPRSSAATTRPTCSASTRTSRERGAMPTQQTQQTQHPAMPGPVSGPGPVAAFVQPLGIGLLIALAFLLTYLTALHKPQPHHLPVGVIAPPEVVAQLQRSISAQPGTRSRCARPRMPLRHASRSSAVSSWRPTCPARTAGCW